MKLSEKLDLPLSAVDVAAMYADPGYAGIRGTVLGASSAESSVEGDVARDFTVRSELTLPADRVPDMVRRFVGATVTVTETQAWSAPGPDGSRTGTMHLLVKGTPASMTADLRLSPLDATSSQVLIEGDLVAKVPLLGPKLEKAAMPHVSTVLRAEERAAAAYRDKTRG